MESVDSMATKEAWVLTMEQVEMSSQDKVLLSTLPIERGWIARDMHYYKGIWLQTRSIPAYLALHDHFRTRPDDAILATALKSGTTWLKGLAFAVVHRTVHPPTSEHHPLLTANSHDLIKMLEIELYAGGKVPDYLDGLPSPRLFGTHLPLSLLPQPITCKVIFLCRNPGDNFISLWKFILEMLSTAGSKTVLPMDKAFDLFCRGRSPYGPYWDTVLSYWEARKKDPEKVLFLHYEDLLDDPCLHVKKMAAFLGLPFTEEEEKAGVVESIVELCSFDKMSNLAVNKSKDPNVFGAHVFFREGRAGDWATYLTPDMVQRLNQITEEKMQGSGLDLTLP